MPDFISGRDVGDERGEEETTMAADRWRQFHRLWTKAVGTPDYVKKEWTEFAVLLERHFGPPPAARFDPQIGPARSTTPAFRLGQDTCPRCGTTGRYDCPACGVPGPWTEDGLQAAPPVPPETATVARLVHYVRWARHMGVEHLAAVVVGGSHSFPGDPTCVDLFVMDRDGGWTVKDVPYEREGAAGTEAPLHTWHWPERV